MSDLHNYKEYGERIKNIRSPFIMEILNRQYPTVIEKLTAIWDNPFYIVGGWVRDYVMGRESPDLDIVTVGDALELGKKIKKIYPLWRVYSFKRYHTLKIVSVFGEIDISSARKELYPDIAARPVIELSDIYEDMYRRDFTINAMAISLENEELYDPFNGINDIQNGILRVLHDKSFIDDPTRIIRFARYAVRLNFKADASTINLLKNALNVNVFDFLARERLSKEILVIFKKEKEPYKIIKYLNELGVMSSILQTNLYDVNVPISQSPVEVLVPFLLKMPSDKILFALHTLFSSADKEIKNNLKEAGFGF